jgi:plastocyanin
MIQFEFLGRGLAPGLVVAATLFVVPHAAAAAPDGNAAGGATRPPPTGAEFARLEAQVNEQRQLIIQLMQNEQQRYDMLLKLIGSGSLPPVSRPGDAPGDPNAGSHGAGAADNSSAGAPGKAAKGSPALPQRKVAALDGKVSVSGGDLTDVYVFVENVRGSPVRGRSIEIKQENKQFIPHLAVVQAGTEVVFPNLDTVFHNVFSTSPRNAFDLGSYRGGDKPRSVVMTAPGLVEIFCNVHQKMNANVMVVPNSLYTKVRPDGTFRIENVPVGSRKIVAWSPNTKLSAQKVDVTASGGRATFSLEYEEAPAHTNKLGLPYGSYK